MDSKRMARLHYTFTQAYGGWYTTPVVDSFTARTNTFDIMETMDLLEREVYRDRDFALATEMLENIHIPVTK